MTRTLFTLVGMAVALSAAPASAQRAYVAPRSVEAPQAQLPVVAPTNVASQPIQKPLAGVQNRATVSPYLNLDANFSDTNTLPRYQTLVRPQLDQQRINTRARRELQSLGRQVDSLSGQNGTPATGSPYIRETGHPAIFMNTMQFFGNQAKR